MIRRMKWLGTAVALVCSLSAQAAPEEPRKILVVVTSNDHFGSTAETTGYWLGEVSHFYDVAIKSGFEIDFASPLGGSPPVDEGSMQLKDPVNVRFLADTAAIQKLEHSLTAAQVNPDDYAAIYFAGGHGPMWDLVDNEDFHSLSRAIYERGGVVSAVCHGPVALLNLRLSDGTSILDGKRATGLANIEERLTGKAKKVPFLLQTEMKKRGARYHRGFPFASHVEVDGRLVTGQNPKSTRAVAQKVVALLTP